MAEAVGEGGPLGWPSAEAARELDALPVGRPIAAPPVLFRKIEADDIAAWTERFGGGPDD
jgi:methionyl-tRNA synthetase